jgi:hypothetical protein
MNADASNEGRLPSTVRAMTAETTLDTTMTANERGAKSPRITSLAKKTPPIGALKVAEMPAAAPHATSVRTTGAGACAICPSTEPIALPICTIGPSRPAAPPNPIVVADARALIRMTRGRMTPPRSATAAITSGTPCPRASGAKRAVNQAAAAPPQPTETISANGPRACAKNPVNQTAIAVSNPIKARKAIAP